MTRRKTMTADELRAAIERLGTSQMGLSRTLGVAPRTVRRWVSGEAPIPRIAVVAVGLLMAARK